MNMLEEMSAAEFEALRAACDAQKTTVDKLNVEPMTATEFLALRPQIGTQAEVADAMGRDRRSIGRWERGERKVPTPAALWMRTEAMAAQTRRQDTLAAAAEMETAK